MDSSSERNSLLRLNARLLAMMLANFRGISKGHVQGEGHHQSPARARRSAFKIVLEFSNVLTLKAGGSSCACV